MYPVAQDDEFQAHIAQSVEHSLGKGEVTGSNPVMSTNLRFRGLESRGRGRRDPRRGDGAFQPV